MESGQDGPVFRYVRVLRKDGAERTIPPDLQLRTLYTVELDWAHKRSVVLVEEGLRSRLADVASKAVERARVSERWQVDPGEPIFVRRIRYDLDEWSDLPVPEGTGWTRSTTPTEPGVRRRRCRRLRQRTPHRQEAETGSGRSRRACGRASPSRPSRAIHTNGEVRHAHQHHRAVPPRLPGLDGRYDNFALFRCFVDGAPDAAIVAVNPCPPAEEGVAAAARTASTRRRSRNSRRTPTRVVSRPCADAAARPPVPT